MMAFVQLLIAGMALATRFEESRRGAGGGKRGAPAGGRCACPWRRHPPNPVWSHDRRCRRSRKPPSCSPRPWRCRKWPIRGPSASCRKLAQARVAGDMGRAIIKLEEALDQSPDDPSVRYELGLVHEQMGVFDIAASHYREGFRNGRLGRRFAL